MSVVELWFILTYSYLEGVDWHHDDEEGTLRMMKDARGAVRSFFEKVSFVINEKEMCCEIFGPQKLELRRTQDMVG